MGLGDVGGSHRCDLPKCSRALLQPERQKSDCKSDGETENPQRAGVEHRDSAPHLSWLQLFSTL